MPIEGRKWESLWRRIGRGGEGLGRTEASEARDWGEMLRKMVCVGLLGGRRAMSGVRE